ncbi:MAG: hypothetical protein BWY76_03425 [bacterium ADurb.Bin429]|nr:MAG: hypothetical protein BWY76_03425 [bacterium ADurb.Bin429]
MRRATPPENSDHVCEDAAPSSSPGCAPGSCRSARARALARHTSSPRQSRPSHTPRARRSPHPGRGGGRGCARHRRQTTLPRPGDGAGRRGARRPPGEYEARAAGRSQRPYPASAASWQTYLCSHCAVSPSGAVDGVPGRWWLGLRPAPSGPSARARRRCFGAAWRPDALHRSPPRPTGVRASDS